MLQAYPDAEVQPNVWSEPNGLLDLLAGAGPPAGHHLRDGRVTGPGIHAGRHMPEGCHP